MVLSNHLTSHVETGLIPSSDVHRRCRVCLQQTRAKRNAPKGHSNSPSFLIASTSSSSKKLGAHIWFVTSTHQMGRAKAPDSMELLLPRSWLHQKTHPTHPMRYSLSPSAQHAEMIAEEAAAPKLKQSVQLMAVSFRSPRGGWARGRLRCVGLRPLGDSVRGD